MAKFGAATVLDQFDHPLTTRDNRAGACTMSKTLNLHEAKTQLSRLVEEAAAGEEIIIAKAGVPRARLVALPPEKPLREPGGWKGRLWVSDDFDAPLPPDVLASFYGE